MYKRKEKGEEERGDDATLFSAVDTWLSRARARNISIALNTRGNDTGDKLRPRDFARESNRPAERARRNTSRKPDITVCALKACGPYVIRTRYRAFINISYDKSIKSGRVHYARTGPDNTADGKTRMEGGSFSQVLHSRARVVARRRNYRC